MTAVCVDLIELEPNDRRLFDSICLFLMFKCCFEVNSDRDFRTVDSLFNLLVFVTLFVVVGIFPLIIQKRFFNRTKTKKKKKKRELIVVVNIYVDVLKKECYISKQ